MTGCASYQQGNLYQDLGGEAGVARISRNFIRQIGSDATIRAYFKDTDLKRFHEKLSEHICQLSGGGCDYTGDDMPSVHANMHITETDFNRTVDLLINAMDQENIPHTTQNRLLKILAPMYTDIVYR